MKVTFYNKDTGEQTFNDVANIAPMGTMFQLFFENDDDTKSIKFFPLDTVTQIDVDGIPAPKEEPVEPLLNTPELAV